MVDAKAILLLLLPILPGLFLIASLANSAGESGTDPVAFALGLGAAIVALLALMIKYNLLPH